MCVCVSHFALPRPLHPPSPVLVSKEVQAATQPPYLPTGPQMHQQRLTAMTSIVQALERGLRAELNRLSQLQEAA